MDLTNVVALNDGSIAMRGAIDVLAGSAEISFLGIIESLVDVTPTPLADRTVLLFDPFAPAITTVLDAAELPQYLVGLAMSACLPPADVRTALLLGVRGFLRREDDVTTVLTAVRTVALGGLYLDLSLMLELLVDEQDLPRASSDVASGLTQREREVLALVARGLTHKQIATRLHLSKATVDTYVHRVRQKVGSVNKAGLTRFAMNLDLLDGTG